MRNRHRSVKLLVQAASVFLLVFALADGVAAQAVSFLARRDFVVAGRPLSVAIGDFNRDGIQDLVVATIGANVSVLFGNRDGTFQPAMIYGGLTFVVFVAVGDFNRDGIQDLAVAHSHGASILIGNADGTFQTPVPVVNGLADPGSIAVGDFNKDGFQDLALASTVNSIPIAPSSANILLGNGDGTFQTVRSFGTGRRSKSLAIGDFNGDGLQDLAVTNSGSTDVTILIGNGDGNFQPAKTFGAGFTPSSVAIGDFNGDGLQDLAVANTGSNDVSILVGNGDGTFQPPRDFATGSSPSSVAIGDFNGDGLQDLAVANSGSNDVSILVGNGDATFQAPQDFATGSSPSSVAIGDFNHDGAQDLAVANLDANSVSILLGKETDFLVVPNASTNQEGNVWSPSLFLNNSARQQLVISATEFAAPGGAIQITGISFRPDAEFGSPFTDTYPQFRLDLSTTQKNVNFFEPGRNPDGVTMTFADNLGLDNITVYDGPLTISTTATGPSSGPNNFDIEINFQRPFIYDPAVGNLLLDMRWPGTANGLVTSFDASSPQITVISTLLATSDFGGMNASTADQFAVSGTVVRFSFTPVEIINDLINFVPITSTYRTTSETAGCPSGFVGKFSFDARLTNENSSPPISGLIAKVKTLTSGNLLHNADGGNGGVGSTLTVLNEDGYSDGKMIPGEFVDVPFTICLKKLAPFSFFVDVLGLPR